MGGDGEGGERVGGRRVDWRVDWRLVAVSGLMYLAVQCLTDSHWGVAGRCSAGVGRTGSFIAIDYLLDEAQAEKVVDLYGLTQRMRKNRISMIQTAVSDSWE